MNFFKAFFAVNPSQVKKKVVISPIVYPSQFEKIISQKGKHYKSTLSYLVADFKDVTFIKTPMTQSAIYDLVVLLAKTRCKEIVFLGAIGGLQKVLKIGDIVVSKKAGDVYSVKSIHEETKKKLSSLRKKGVIGIDFESQSFFKAAKQAKLSAIAYYVVTDLPLSKPFYLKKTKKQIERVKSSINQIIQMIVTII